MTNKKLPSQNHENKATKAIESLKETLSTISEDDSKMNNVKKLSHTLKALKLKGKATDTKPKTFQEILDLVPKQSLTQKQISHSIQNALVIVGKNSQPKTTLKMLESIKLSFTSMIDKWVNECKPIFYSYEIGYHYKDGSPAPLPSNEININNSLLKDYTALDLLYKEIENEISKTKRTVQILYPKKGISNQPLEKTTKEKTLWELTSDRKTKIILSCASISQAAFEGNKIIEGTLPNLKFNIPEPGKPLMCIQAFFYRLYELEILSKSSGYSGKDLVCVFQNTFTEPIINPDSLRPLLTGVYLKSIDPNFLKYYEVIKL
ncbi:hypothetical protein [Ancylomarina sp. 16SWW S1-10-2]|uniref:hypothetical protein n=1 Tax=Ancylomarina sp. 16SWW S1-10-2 TaxID=2499681 RepID=UPI0012ADD505|nr:hypothetical protein [Ancylomarina sp. 16SWW S1-10-2]MRT92385.1 hypothetical protein [Ancylomarina sp. 16SWW S1-10-2]